MQASEAQKRATAKWNSKNQIVRSFAFYPHRDGDMELLAHLDSQENKSEYIRQLIREDMER